MAELRVELDDHTLAALRQYAHRRRTPVAWLIRHYIDYLLAGGQPPVPRTSEPLDAKDLAALAARGGAFDWLADEPEIYSAADGEAVPQP